MTNVFVKKIYDISADKIWRAVSKADSMDKYLPEMITACDLSSNEEGGKRVCSTENGPIHETVLLNDQSTMTFKYSIDNDDAPLPVSNYIGTVRVKELSANQSEFTWAAEFEPKGMSEDEVVPMLGDVLGTLMDNISTSLT